MAKKKDDAMDFEEVKPFVAEAPADDRDAKIAQLERELADLRVAQSQPVTAAPAGPQVMRHFKVDLQHAPSRIVKAVDSANAFQEFFRKSGIIASDFQPSAAEHPGPCGVFLPDGSFRPDPAE